MNSFYAYSFLTGLFIGAWTNFFSKIVISSLVIYIVHPKYFSLERFTPLYQRICEKTYPYISKIYTIENGDEIKIEIVPFSPSINSLQPLQSVQQTTLKLNKK